MNQLPKYLLIIFLTCLVLFGAIWVVHNLDENFVKNYHQVPEYDSSGNQLMQQVPYDKSPFNPIFKFLLYFIAFFPQALVLFLGGFYVYKNPSLEGYFKSLVIPFIFILLFYLLSYIFPAPFLIVGSYFSLVYMGIYLIFCILIQLIVFAISYQIHRNQIPL